MYDFARERWECRHNEDPHENDRRDYITDGDEPVGEEESDDVEDE